MQLDNAQAVALLSGELNLVNESQDKSQGNRSILVDFPNPVFESSLGLTLAEFGRRFHYDFQLPFMMSSNLPSHAVTWDSGQYENVDTFCFSESPFCVDNFFFGCWRNRWQDALPLPEDLPVPDYWKLGETYRFLAENVCSPFEFSGREKRVLLIFSDCDDMLFDPFELIRRYLQKDHFLVFGFVENPESDLFMNPNLLSGFSWETSQHTDMASAISDCAAVITNADRYVPMALACGVPVATLHPSIYSKYGLVLDCDSDPNALERVLQFIPDRRIVESVLTFIITNFLIDCSSVEGMAQSSSFRSWISLVGFDDSLVKLVSSFPECLNNEDLFEIASAIMESEKEKTWKMYLSQVNSLSLLHGEKWTKCRHESLKALFARQLLKAKGNFLLQ